VSLLVTLDRALAAPLRAHEWREGELRSFTLRDAVAGAPRPAEAGEYLVARAPDVTTLWSQLRFALEKKRPLAILSPSPPAAAVALFTSGTTGEPKAVFHAEASLLASSAQLARAFPGNAPTASLLSPWAMAGIAFHCLLPAQRRSSLAFGTAPFLDWAASAGKVFRDLEIELLTLSPTHLEMLLRAGIEPAWRGRILSLTAPLKRTHRDALALLAGREASEIYGMTEAAGPVLLDGASLGAELRLSGAGELEIKGSQLMMGYSAAGRFEPAPEWHATGDLFACEGSRFHHQARLRELIDVGGRKIAPRMLEETLESLGEIAECLAFPVQLGATERPGVAYVRKPQCTLGRDELSDRVERHLRERLSPELRPRLWLEVDAVPRLAGGKPDRRGARTRWGYPAKEPRAGTSSSGSSGPRR
jgi:o-succinylbenzoate---CoA ligase